MSVSDADPLAALDAYELRHLAGHLAAAQRVGELHRLLSLEWAEQAPAAPAGTARPRLLRWRRPRPAEPAPVIVHNAWYAAKDRIGDVGGYVGDLRRAQDLAAGSTATATHAGSAIGLEVRYAVARASVSSLASSIPAPLLGELARRGGWSFEQASAYARQAATPRRRAESLAALIPVAPGEHAGELAWEAIAMLADITADEGRIGPYPGEYTRRLVIEQLAPALPRAHLHALLRQVAEFRAADDRTYAEEALLVPLARCGETSTALDRCLAFDNEVIRSRTLDQFADLLSEPEVDRALAVARADDPAEVSLLAVAAPRLAAFGRGNEALAAVADFMRLRHPGAMMMALRALPAGSDVATVERALGLAPSIDNAENRARVLVGMLARAAAGRPDVLTLALAAIEAVASEYPRSRLLIELAPHLTDAQVPLAAAEAGRIEDVSARVSALADLARGRPAGIRAALRLLLNAPRVADHAQSGIAVFEPEQVLAALERRELSSTSLAGVVGDLPDGLLPRAVAIARRIGDENEQKSVHARLTAQRQLLGGRLDDVAAVADESVRSELLAHLGPRVPDADVARVLELTLTLGDADARATAVAPLAARLTAGQLERALDTFWRSFSRAPRPGWRWVGALLAPQLPGELLAKALKLATRQRDEAMRGWALAGLIPFLDGALLDQAVDRAGTIGEDGEYQRDAALAAAAGRFAALGDLDRALAVARAVAEPVFQGKAVEAIAAAAPAGRRAELLVLARRVSTDPSQPRRGTEYQVRALLAVALLEEGDLGRQLRAEAFGLVHGTDGLTAVAEVLPPAELDFVLSRLTAIRPESDRLPALTAAAPRLTGALLTTGLDLAHQFTDPESAAEALFAFACAPAVTGPARTELLRSALDAACRVTSSYRRRELFEQLAGPLGELSPADAHRAWRTALAAVANADRGEVLRTVTALMPLIARLGGQAALDEASTAITDATRWWP